MRIFALIAALSGCAVASSGSLRVSDESLYKRHDWFGLRDRIAAGKVTDPLVLGATAAAFGQDDRACKLLVPLLAGDHKEDASTWLSYVEMRNGHYQAAARYVAGASGDPHDPLALTFSGLADQVTAATSHASVPYRILQRKLFLRASVNRQPVEFILDSDANISFVSETAAKQLGLTVRGSSATTLGALGAASRLKMASADVTVGKTLIRNVAFTVLPDKAALFATLTPHQQGALGLPVLLALKRVSWDRSGRFRIGVGCDPGQPASALAFDGIDPIVHFSSARGALTGVFDTGAEETALWPPFASRFADVIKRSGTVGKREVQGFGGSGTVSEVTLPSLKFGLGGVAVRAKPAYVLT